MGERCAAMGRVTPTGANPDARPVLVMLAAGMATRYGGGCKPLAPVGLHGEAVIDLTAADAAAAGFGDVVLVVGPQSAPAISYHVRRCWPSTVSVSLVCQPVPLGTAHAVLCAREQVGGRSLAVVNGDDVYGAPALGLLADHLAGDDPAHANVAFALSDTIVTPDPVTRGTCEIGVDGGLVSIVERRKVHLTEDGRFASDDGLEPAELPGDTPVSVNLWGFRPSIWPVLAAAVQEAHPAVGPGGVVEDPSRVDTEKEVLLPEVVGNMLAAARRHGEQQRVLVLKGPGRCIGVTHADDLPVVRSLLAEMVGQGIRAESPWEA